MFAILKAVTWRHQVFFEAENGDVYRVWFGGEPHPFIERLTPSPPAEYAEALADLRDNRQTGDGTR